MDTDFSMEELDRALNRCKEKSNPEVNGINYKMLKMLTRKFKIELLARYYYAFRNGFLFESWRKHDIYR